MPRRSAVAVPAALAVAMTLATRPALAYEIWIDLNTYVEGRQGGNGTALARTNAFAGADGVWLVTANAYGDNNLQTSNPPFGSGIATNTNTGFTLSEWRQMITNIAGGSAKIATEDNPAFGYPGSGPHPNNKCYLDAVAIKGGNATAFQFTDFFQYNETGSTVGGTILSTASGSGRTVNGTTYDTQVQTYAATHGGKIGYLTRGYSSSGWINPSEAANADAQVSAGVMETVSLEGQNTAGWINSITKPLYSGATLVRPAKPAYVLLTTATFRNLPGLYYLKQYAPEAVASGMVKFVLNNDYATTATAGDGSDGYGFFGQNTTAGADLRDTVQGQQQLLNALKTATPVETWQWKTVGTSNWSSRANWAVTPLAGTDATFRAGQPGPANKWDAAAFTSPDLTGQVAVNVNTASAEALAVYFDGPASYTVNGPNPLTLTGYGTLGADGRVPTVSGAIPTGPSTDATAYAANIVPIQVKGAGVHTINAPISLDYDYLAAGLMIDNQTTAGQTFSMTGRMDLNTRPLYVIGSGNTALTGPIRYCPSLTKSGSGTLTLGGASSSTSNDIQALNAAGGLTLLNAQTAAPELWVADAVTDIASGATVRVNSAQGVQLNPYAAVANVTINSGGTFDIGGRPTTLNGLAGTSANGLVTNNGTAVSPTAGATLVLGQASNPSYQGGTYAGRINNGTAVVAVRKVGAGTQTLAGTGTYSGGTTVNGGTLVAGTSTALGTGAISVNGAGGSAGPNAGTLAVTGNSTLAGTIVFQGPRSDPAATSPGQPHLLNVSGNNTIASNLTISAGGGLGTLVRSDAGTLTLSGTLTNNNNPGYARPYILYGTGDGRLTGTIANGTATTALTKQGPGTWSVPGTATYTGPTLVQGGTLRLGKNAFAPVLTNAGGADVQAGTLVLDYTGGTSPLAQVKTLLAQSYATGFTNAASRLRSTTAAGDLGLGYADTGTAVVIAATIYGDATLDGQVNFDDFVALQSSFGQTNATFGQGDFDYNGTVNFNDFVTLQSNFGKTATGGRAAFSRAEYAAVMSITTPSQVPEPAALSLLAVATAGLSRRRRIA